MERLGSAEIRQKGSHRQYRHVDGRGTTVPFHAGRDISPILLRKIASDIGMTVTEFLGHRFFESRPAPNKAIGADRAVGFGSEFWLRRPPGRSIARR